MSEKKFRVYKHVMESAQYVFQHEDSIGQTAVFVKHIYYTDDPLKIAELDAVCEHMQKQAKRGYAAYIYIDPEMSEATAEDLDPMEKLRKQIREEERTKLLAEMAAQNLVPKDAGTYTPATNIVQGNPTGAKPVTANPVPSMSGQSVKIAPKVTVIPKASEIVPPAGQ